MVLYWPVNFDWQTSKDGVADGQPVAVSGWCCVLNSTVQDTADEDVMQAYQQIRAERQLAEQQQSQQIRQRHQPSPQANGPTAEAAAVQTPRQPADVSQLMADKMLAGWALLGDHCPL